MKLRLLKYVQKIRKLKEKTPDISTSGSVKDTMEPDGEQVKETVTPENKQEETVLEKSSEFLELEQARQRYGQTDRDKVWAFTAGNTSQDFRGNPKYLFVYINKYRPDIKAYWLCSNEETIACVRALGFYAHKIETPAAQYVINHTGVLVAEQVKVLIPEGMENVKYLNLWHGVGLKHIERKLLLGDIAEGIARKYVMNGTFYRDHQLLTVTSPTIEPEFESDLGVDKDKLIRSGYLRCEYQQNFDPVVTFDHDLRKIKGLPEDTRLIVYAPTYRAKLGETFSQAIRDMEALHECCERNHLLLIFKVHPYMETEPGFLRAAKTYGNRKRFWFWDNKDDFYEIMDQIDMAIIDYSSILSDMVAVGIRHYIRYIFDFEEYMQEGFTTGDYFDRTMGTVCRSFDELLHAIDVYDRQEDQEEFEKIKNKFWAYADGKEDFEKTIDCVLNFQIEEREYPNLYSFDVFDTLFSRKVLDPEGIFYYVREKMIRKGGFPIALWLNYPSVRHTAEFNVREYYTKTKEIRQSDKVEIHFDEIFDRMSEVYGLTMEQKEDLKRWELEAELENVIPLPEQINLVKEYVSGGEKVVLVSDMYLPQEFIRKMLKKADPLLAELPLFLSSDYGVQKTTQKLYFEVYKSFEPFYDFGKWIHYGDNIRADQVQARHFGIHTRKIEKPEFGMIQEKMVKALGTYDAFLVAALQARMCAKKLYERDEFVISFVALCMVPYVDWVLRDAQRRGYETLYFISRDGHPLQRIADAIIRERGLDIKTKYIYASRRTWRIPSFIHEVDEDFWLPYGNFVGLTSKGKLFKAMDLDEATFRKLFPALSPDSINFKDKDEVNNLINVFRESEKYQQYLLKKAAEERVLVSGYLKQEIDSNEKFAVVEYWGRGYTQDCMVRLWQDIVGSEVDVPFYYSRSIIPSERASVRHNFTTNNQSQLFVESFFANMPYKSIENYEEKDGKIQPVIVPIEYDRNLYESMEQLLPEFAQKYAALELTYPEDTDRLLYEFALNFFNDNKEDVFFAQTVGSLMDSVALYGRKREFAPPYTMEDLQMFADKKMGRGDTKVSTSITMSVVRTDEDVRRRYCEMYQILPGDNLAGGRVLSEEEQETNRLFKNKYNALVRRAAKFDELYKKAADHTVVTDKIILVANGKRLKGTGLDMLNKALAAQDRFEVKTVLVAKKQYSDEDLAKELASARYIIVYKAVSLFCKTVFRDETEEILLCNTAFPLYNQGLMTNYFLKWRKKYMELAGRNRISVMQIPAAGREEYFRKNYSNDRKTKCDILGCCNTDIYFDETIAKRSREKLLKLFPEAEGKKMILYMPMWRTRKDCPEWLSMLEMDVLKKYLGDEYAVVVNFNVRQKKGEIRNIIEIPGFSKEIIKKMTLRELMVAADIIVGDYRDTFFESALLHKPVYSTAYDYEKIIQSNNMSLNANSFEDYIFCPIVRSAEDLIKHLKQADEYDYAPMERFRNEMLTSCDGKSLKRVIDYLMR